MVVILVALIVIPAVAFLSMSKNQEVYQSPRINPGSTTSTATRTATTPINRPIWNEKWTYDSDGTWMANLVSMGSNGERIFNEHGIYNNHHVIFSSTGANMVDYFITKEASGFRVESADKADIHASLTFHPLGLPDGSGNIHVKKFTSLSTIPDWEKIIPISVLPNCECWDLAIIDNGNKIVVWVKDAVNNNYKLIVYDSNGIKLSENIFTLSLSSGIVASKLSQNGDLFALKTKNSLDLIETATGQKSWFNYDFSNINDIGLAINSDATKIAYGSAGKVVIYEKTGSSYTQTGQISLQPTFVTRALEMTSNGNYLYGTSNKFNPGSNGRIYSWDISNGVNELMHYDFLGDGGIYRNFAEEISVSDSGDIFAVGLWGNEDFSGKEIFVFNKNSNQPIYSVDTQGSVMDLEISPTGDQLVTANKDVHAELWGGGGSVKYFSSN